MDTRAAFDRGLSLQGYATSSPRGFSRHFYRVLSLLPTWFSVCFFHSVDFALAIIISPFVMSLIIVVACS